MTAKCCGVAHGGWHTAYAYDPEGRQLSRHTFADLVSLVRAERRRAVRLIQAAEVILPSGARGGISGNNLAFVKADIMGTPASMRPTKEKRP